MKPRGILIAGNWKMNYGPPETQAFFSDLKTRWKTKSAAKTKSILFTPSLSLSAAREAAQGLPVAIGAQNAHWEKSGAFTGELSGPMLGEIGIQHVLVGHSERRQFFGESDETARMRAESLLKQGFHVVFCVGETKTEREKGQTESVLHRQLSAIKNLPKDLQAKFVLAYEPVWAIGTGLTATPAQAEEAHQIVRKFLWDNLGFEPSGRISILYGGSVTPANVDELLACPNVDGVLAGGSSLKPESFLHLISAGEKLV